MLSFSALAESAAPAKAPNRAEAYKLARTKKEKFTPSEKQFLAEIANKASSIVGKNLKEARRQLNQINNSGAQGAQILSAVKSAYVQYRTYFALSEYNYFNALNSDLPWGMREEGTPLENEYSPHSLYYYPKEREKIFSTYEQDMRFIKNDKSNCGFKKKNISEHYEKQMAQIITLVPVVLEMRVTGAEPTDQEVLEAYENLIANISQTYQKFTNYEPSELEGLWVYQAVVDSMVTENPKLESIRQSLEIKINPQGFEIFTDWIKSVFFSYNILLIGCTAIAVATVNPVIAVGCALANTAVAGYNLYNDKISLGEKRQEWMAGISSLEDLKLAKTQVLTDYALLGFNIFASGTLIKMARSAPILSYNFHKEIITSNLKTEVLRQNAKAHARAVLEDQVKDQARGQTAGFIVLGAGYAINTKEFDKVSQAAADLILLYKQKKLFTFKDTARVNCHTAASMSNE
jgi:hypothetical protein